MLVANRAHAKLFFHRPGEGERSVLIRELDHPEGRLKSGEINSDRGGRAFPRHGTGSSSLDKAHAPVEQEAERFALEIAEVLDEGALESAYTQLVLIAEPKFLGRLKKVLDRSTAARIALTVPKDIAELDAWTLEGMIGPIIAEETQAAAAM